jgi:cell pole-organizing protein PopZ
MHEPIRIRASKVMTATNAPSYATELRAEQKAHEPSMEDILASIRRMIADDDVLPLSRRARAAARSPVVTPEVAEAAAPQPAPADAFLSLVHRLGRESDLKTPDVLPPPAPVAEAVVTDAPASVLPFDPAPAPVHPRTPTLKLRDFALKNFLARPAPVQDAPVQDAPVQDAPVQDAAGQETPITEPGPAATFRAAADLRPSLAEAETRADPAVEPALASSVVMLSPRPAHAAETRLKFTPLTFRVPDFAAPSGPAVAVAPVPEPVSENVETPAPPQAALLSSASDLKIGASFEALAETLLARDKDLVERAAREMLRPMLKSWLDDHLPSLVERLVRAEIERVARGRG